MMFDLFVKEVQGRNLRGAILFDEPLSRHTSFKIGGPCRVLIKPAAEADLIAVVSLAKKMDLPWVLIGNGSNILVSDMGYDGIVVKTDEMQGISVNSNLVHADCGALVMAVAQAAFRHSLSGLEFAYGIPGSIGGAIFMNAGAYGGEIKDVVQTVKYMDTSGEIVQFGRDACCFSYRESYFMHHPGTVILSVCFQLTDGVQREIREKMDFYLSSRREKQPIELPNAGSTFKRPAENYAGSLVELCGLKGFSVGGAQVSTKHAGFIVNTGDATAKDVLKLISHIQQAVFEKHGIALETEIRFIGPME
jgi:UDP-N-acetylmuramate dehydrogenase